MKNLIYCGFLVNDVVTFKTEWCAVCTKSRTHEVYQGWMICPICSEMTQTLEVRPTEIITEPISFLS